MIETVGQKKLYFFVLFSIRIYFIKCHLSWLNDQKACFGAQSHVFDPREVGEIFVPG